MKEVKIYSLLRDILDNLNELSKQDANIEVREMKAQVNEAMKLLEESNYHPNHGKND